MNKLKKDATVSLRIPAKFKAQIVKEHKSFQKWFDLAVLFEVERITKPLDKALFEIENKEALESYFGYEEPDDSLDKQREKKWNQ